MLMRRQSDGDWQGMSEPDKEPPRFVCVDCGAGFESEEDWKEHNVVEPAEVGFVVSCRPFSEEMNKG